MTTKIVIPPVPSLRKITCFSFFSVRDMVCSPACKLWQRRKRRACHPFDLTADALVTVWHVDLRLLCRPRYTDDGTKNQSQQQEQVDKRKTKRKKKRPSPQGNDDPVASSSLSPVRQKVTNIGGRSGDRHIQRPIILPEDGEGPFSSSLTSAPGPQPCSSSRRTAAMIASAAMTEKREGVASSNHRPSILSSTEAVTLGEVSEGMLTEETIRVAARTRQLRDIKTLKLVVDTSQVSVEGVWDAIPYLHTLVLDGSRLVSFRDLGVGLQYLNTLSLEFSGVEHLDGIGALSGLRELRLARNYVSDVTPLACHGNLQVLDLTSNRVNDMDALEILGTLPLLYSVDLHKTPLSEALSKVKNEHGREVVQQFIPQLRMLDGVHLSYEQSRGVARAETLDEARDLICQEVHHACAAWGEDENIIEKSTTDTPETLETNGTIEKALDNRAIISPGREGRTPLEPKQCGEAGVSVAVANPGTGIATAGGGRLPATIGAGMVHWDSDLTQGGRQVFSGNPSAAIRQHKSGKDVGRRRITNTSPTRVLDTLDLAQMMEHGLKQRKHAQLAHRVSEWRRETRADSLPQHQDLRYTASPKDCASANTDDMEYVERPGAAHSHRRVQQADSARDDGQERGNPGDRPTGSASLTGSAMSVADDAGRAQINDVRRTRGVRKGLESWASWSPLGIEVAEQDGPTCLVVEGRKGSGVADDSRPWTTGDFGIRHKFAREPTTARRKPHQTKTGAVSGGTREVGPRRHRRRRPQTATQAERNHHYHDHDQDDDVKQGAFKANARWQPVWESLLTARLVLRYADEDAVIRKVENENPSRGLARVLDDEPGPLVEQLTRNVDFRSQRRARSARSRSARVDSSGTYKGIYSVFHKSNSIPSVDTTGGHSSDEDLEVDGRNLAEINALDTVHALTAEATAEVSPSNGDNGAIPRVSLSCSSPPPVTITTSLQGCEGEEVLYEAAISPQLQRYGETEQIIGTPPPEKRRQGTASVEARRSLATMDDSGSSSSSSSSNSSSEDEDDCARSVSRPVRRPKTFGESGNLASDTSCGGNKPGPTRHFSSTRASQMLGFNLRESLAAIDEWTDKAIAPSDESGGPVHAVHGTPRLEAATTPGTQPVGFFAEDTDGFPPSRLLSAALQTKYRRRKEGEENCLPRSASAGVDCTSIGGEFPSAATFASMTGDSHDGDDGGDDSEGEAVLSVAAARAALGISKGTVGPTAAAAAAAFLATASQQLPSGASQTSTLRREDLVGRSAERSSAAVTSINATSKENRHGVAMSTSQYQGPCGPCGGVGTSTGGVSSGKRGRGTRLQFPPPPGMAASIADEALERMLRRQPRTVPELRTKESFRNFFRGMEAERMGRLLRGAYEGAALSAEEIDRKIEKRLGLVGDMLVR